MEVHFLDESHCAVKFLAPETLIPALYEKLLDKNEVRGMGNFQASLQDTSGKVKWRAIQPYSFMQFTKELWARFMTNMDRLHNNSRHAEIVKEIQEVKDRSVMEAKASRSREIALREVDRSRSREQRRFKQVKKGEGSQMPTMPNSRGLNMREMVRKQKKFWE